MPLFISRHNAERPPPGSVVGENGSRRGAISVQYRRSSILTLASPWPHVEPQSGTLMSHRTSDSGEEKEDGETE